MKISPTNDLAFKKVLASEENKDILAGLINDFFGIVAEEINITNPYSIEICKKFQAGGDINELRHTLRDVTATFKTADFVSELQVKRNQHFDERSLYYLCKRYCQNYNVEGRMKTGRDGKPNRYSSLRPVYALNILDYIHFDEDEDSLRILELYDPVRQKYPNKRLLKFGCFELPKTKIETANQKHWHDFFTSKEIGENAPDYIKKASEVIDFVNLGEEERNVAESIEKYEATRQDELDYSFYEGEKKGIIKTAISMLQKGLAPKLVAECTGLPLEQIQKL